jgi:hypothetical protein
MFHRFVGAFVVSMFLTSSAQADWVDAGSVFDPRSNPDASVCEFRLVIQDTGNDIRVGNPVTRSTKGSRNVSSVAFPLRALEVLSLWESRILSTSDLGVINNTISRSKGIGELSLRIQFSPDRQFGSTAELTFTGYAGGAGMSYETVRLSTTPRLRLEQDCGVVARTTGRRSSTLLTR